MKNETSYKLLIWILVKTTLVLFTAFCGTVVAVLWDLEEYSLSAVITLGWFMFVVLISIKEERELHKNNDTE